MLSCCKKNKTKTFSIEFMTLCYEGGTQKKFDEIFERARLAGEEKQIFEAHDFLGNLPHHKAAKHGNFEALKWILDKWTKENLHIDLNKPDSNGYTPLMLCCHRGYGNGSGSAAARLPKTKKNRIECIDLLLNYKGKQQYDSID